MSKLRIEVGAAQIELEGIVTFRVFAGQLRVSYLGGERERGAERSISASLVRTFEEGLEGRLYRLVGLERQRAQHQQFVVGRCVDSRPCRKG
jgi:hypothetical protein